MKFASLIAVTVIREAKEAERYILMLRGCSLMTQEILWSCQVDFIDLTTLCQMSDLKFLRR